MRAFTSSASPWMRAAGLVCPRNVAAQKSEDERELYHGPEGHRQYRLRFSRQPGCVSPRGTTNGKKRESHPSWFRSRKGGPERKPDFVARERSGPPSFRQGAPALIRTMPPFHHPEAGEVHIAGQFHPGRYRYDPVGRVGETLRRQPFHRCGGRSACRPMGSAKFSTSSKFSPAAGVHEDVVHEDVVCDESFDLQRLVDRAGQGVDRVWSAPEPALMARSFMNWKETLALLSPNSPRAENGGVRRPSRSAPSRAGVGQNQSSTSLTSRDAWMPMAAMFTSVVGTLDVQGAEVDCMFMVLVAGGPGRLWV